MSNQNAVVGIYKTHTEAEVAVKELQRPGFDMKNSQLWGKTTTPRRMLSGFTTQGTG